RWLGRTRTFPRRFARRVEFADFVRSMCLERPMATLGKLCSIPLEALNVARNVQTVVPATICSQSRVF
ncbi:MAG TPA: hypothetical protein VGS41_04330, partial [Chthonomonadales bacterium]|nr:hypothetical protein [Chthonomonadales bacterium]